MVVPLVSLFCGVVSWLGVLQERQATRLDNLVSHFRCTLPAADPSSPSRCKPSYELAVLLSLVQYLLNSHFLFPLLAFTLLLHLYPRACARRKRRISLPADEMLDVLPLRTGNPFDHQDSLEPTKAGTASGGETRVAGLSKADEEGKKVEEVGVQGNKSGGNFAAQSVKPSLPPAPVGAGEIGGEGAGLGRGESEEVEQEVDQRKTRVAELPANELENLAPSPHPQRTANAVSTAPPLPPRLRGIASPPSLQPTPPLPPSPVKFARRAAFSPAFAASPSPLPSRNSPPKQTAALPSLLSVPFQPSNHTPAPSSLALPQPDPPPDRTPQAGETASASGTSIAAMSPPQAVVKALANKASSADERDKEDWEAGKVVEKAAVVGSNKQLEEAGSEGTEQEEDKAQEKEKGREQEKVGEGEGAGKEEGPGKAPEEKEEGEVFEEELPCEAVKPATNTSTAPPPSAGSAQQPPPHAPQPCPSLPPPPEVGAPSSSSTALFSRGSTAPPAAVSRAYLPPPPTAPRALRELTDPGHPPPPFHPSRPSSSHPYYPLPPHHQQRSRASSYPPPSSGAFPSRSRASPASSSSRRSPSARQSPQPAPPPQHQQHHNRTAPLPPQKPADPPASVSASKRRKKPRGGQRVRRAKARKREMEEGPGGREGEEEKSGDEEGHHPEERRPILSKAVQPQLGIRFLSPLLSLPFLTSLSSQSVPVPKIRPGAPSGRVALSTANKASPPATEAKPQQQDVPRASCGVRVREAASTLAGKQQKERRGDGMVETPQVPHPPAPPSRGSLTTRSPPAVSVPPAEKAAPAPALFAFTSTTAGSSPTAATIPTLPTSAEAVPHPQLAKPAQPAHHAPDPNPASSTVDAEKQQLSGGSGGGVREAYEGTGGKGGVPGRVDGDVVAKLKVDVQTAPSLPPAPSKPHLHNVPHLDPPAPPSFTCSSPSSSITTAAIPASNPSGRATPGGTLQSRPIQSASTRLAPIPENEEVTGEGRAVQAKTPLSSASRHRGKAGEGEGGTVAHAEGRPSPLALFASTTLLPPFDSLPLSLAPQPSPRTSALSLSTSRPLRP